jgi:integrator complex subunit 1
MIAAMLQGKAQFTYGEMKHRNHLLLYTHTLGILELLQPYIFQQQYSDAFSDILTAYFELLRVSRWSLSNRYPN